MLPDPADSWTAINFIECLDSWAAREHPDQDLRVIVTLWLMARHDDPYEGVRRVHDVENRWYGRIRGTYRSADRSVVTCTFRIIEADRTLHCEWIATVNLPD